MDDKIKPIITNIAVYKSIADEAFQKMVQLMEVGCRSKPDGSAGRIIMYDPDQSSFKQSMISIVFMGMWLEALMHLLIVKRYGEKKYQEYDRKTYEDKLKLLDFTDQKLLGRVTKFRKTRKFLVHEKAYFDDGEIRAAQNEAKNAYETFCAIDKHFS